MERSLRTLVSIVVLSTGCSGADAPPKSGDGGIEKRPDAGVFVVPPPDAPVRLPDAAPTSSPRPDTGPPPPDAAPASMLDTGPKWTPEAGSKPPPPDAAPPQCTTAADCPVPNTAPSGCAVASCDRGKCVYHTKDSDGDGHYANDGCRITDGSAYLAIGDDCDDTDPNVHPGEWDGPAGTGPNGENEPDRCNLKDDNCDGLGDNLKTATASCICSAEEHQACWAETDGTPIPYPQNQIMAPCKKGIQICDQTFHWSPCYGAVAPKPEECNGIDDDCDGKIDDNATDQQPFYCDHDKDNHIAPRSVPEVTCPQNLTDCAGGQWLAYLSATSVMDDCDDHDPNRFGGNKEVCDGVDNDCDPEHLVDEIREGDGGLIDLRGTYYRDQDGDGYGAPNVSQHVCAPQVGYVGQAVDCDDTNKSVNPVAAEICNGIDDDCDGKIDAADPKLSGMPAMTGTAFACVNGHIVITQCPGSALDCNADYRDGCETDGTTLANCHACNTACAFSCGATGCDEVASISAGGTHTCAVTTGGVAACWGGNEMGQLGDEHIANGSAVPILVEGLLDPVYSIRASLYDTCAVAGPEKTVFCWGNNANQQCGASAFRNKNPVMSPAAVDDPDSAMPLKNAVQVALSGDHACAIYENGRVACWGDNTDGQCAPQTLFGTTVERPALIRREDQSSAGSLVTDAVAVTTGASHSCLLSQSGHAECWGYNGDGEIGLDPATDHVVWPQVVAGIDRIIEIGTGDYFNCALVDAGDVYCWGDNTSGQLGAAGGPSDSPVKVPGLSGVKHIAVGASFACAISVNGVLSCWGDDTTEQAAVSPAQDELSAQRVPLAQVTSAAAGFSHACAVTADNHAFCWGSNGQGQMGLGQVDADLHATPTMIAPLQ